MLCSTFTLPSMIVFFLQILEDQHKYVLGAYLLTSAKNGATMHAILYLYNINKSLDIYTISTADKNKLNRIKHLRRFLYGRKRFKTEI